MIRHNMHGEVAMRNPMVLPGDQGRVSAWDREGWCNDTKA